MVSNLFSKIFIAIIRMYQICISPLLGKNCRFLPTCSEYAVKAIKKHGVLSGSYLSFKRILKCHPFNEGGVDEPPE